MGDQAIMTSASQQLPDNVERKQLNSENNNDLLSPYCIIGAIDNNNNSDFIPNRLLRASRRQQHHESKFANSKDRVVYSVSARQRCNEVTFARQPKLMLEKIRKFFVQYFHNLSFGNVSASVQRGIAWCLGCYGYFIGKYPYVMLIIGLTFGLGCTSGLRHIKLAPIVDTDFNDPNSPIAGDREMMSGFTVYPCGCDGARTTTTPSPNDTFLSSGDYEEERINEKVLAEIEASNALAEGQRKAHRLSCAYVDNLGKGCHCHTINFAFVMLDDKHKHGFVDLVKFQKLLKVESMIWNNFSAGPKYPDFTFENLCQRDDNRDGNSPCHSFRLQTVDTKELRSALVFNVLPFPYFENSKIMSDVVGSVQTVTDSSGNVWASSVRTLRESFEICHADTDEAREAFRLWDEAINRRLELENKRYFEPVLGIGVRWQFVNKMTKYAEVAVINLLPKFMGTIVAVAFWAVAAMTGSDAVHSKPWLGLIGVTSTLLANTAGIGFMAYLGKEFNYACAGVPFLTLAIGLDDMFALVTGLHRTKPLDPIPIRMQQTMSEAGSAIFITFLTNLVAQSVGSRTPYKIISEFSTYSLVCMVFDFILQLTIFCPSLALLAMLEQRGRNACCCCAVMEKRQEDLYANRSPWYVICCSRLDFEEQNEQNKEQQEGKPSQQQEESDDAGPAASALLRVVHSYARFLIKSQVRYAVLLLYLGYLGVTVYGLTTVSFGMKMENLAPFASPEAAFLRLSREAFADYREVKVLFSYHKIDYRDEEVQRDIEMIYKKIEHSGFFHQSPTMTRWWLRDYMQYLQQNETLYHTVMNDSFLFWDTLHEGYAREKNRQWLIDDDVKSCGIDHAIVCKSRGHVIALNLKDSTRQVATYEFANKLEAQYSKYQLMLFLPEFAEYEMKRNTVYISVYYVLVTVASAGCVAVFFVPHLVLIFWIVAVLLSEIIGLVGLLPFIGIDLDLISLTMLIINVGYVVDFIMHLSFDFMMAPGTNRQDKVVHALTDVGHALIPAGAGTVMSVLAMSTTGMYVYEVYFRSLSLAVAISAIHSCLFLPVFLSFFGPLGDSEIDVEMKEGQDDEAQRTQRPLVNLMALVNKTDSSGQPRRSKIFRQPVDSGLCSGSGNVVYLAGEKDDDEIRLPAKTTSGSNENQEVTVIETGKNTTPKQQQQNAVSGLENAGFAPVNVDSMMAVAPEENETVPRRQYRQQQRQENPFESVNIVEIVYGNNNNGNKKQHRRYHRSSRHPHHHQSDQEANGTEHVNNHIQRRQETAKKIASSRRKSDNKLNTSESTNNDRHHHHRIRRSSYNNSNFVN